MASDGKAKDPLVVLRELSQELDASVATQRATVAEVTRQKLARKPNQSRKRKNSRLK